MTRRRQRAGHFRISPVVQKATRLGGRSANRSPVGNATRGTTNPNRMRRVDRWMTGPQGWRLRPAYGAPPIAVDLGYGASPATAVELFERLRAVSAADRVFGIEIEPERVPAATAARHRRAWSSAWAASRSPWNPSPSPRLQRAAPVRRGRRGGHLGHRCVPPRRERRVHRRHLR